MTFSTKAEIEKKTGKSGLGRFQYLQALINEFQKTSSKEYKLQVLANLANFGYDPVNYEHFRKLNVFDLFLDVLADEQLRNTKFAEFAIGGICNTCLDCNNMKYLLEGDCIELTITCLLSSNIETVLSAITTLIYLLNPDSKSAIATDKVMEKMKEFAKSSDKRLTNLANILLEDIANT